MKLNAEYFMIKEKWRKWVNYWSNYRERPFGTLIVFLQTDKKEEESWLGSVHTLK
jgi:hypothetical protein